MEVIPMNLPRRGSPGGTVGLPFNKRNVEEWSRLDRLTGMMEKAKIETDHWSARSNNAAHKYGKMIDSRERNNQDGSLQQRQRKQMEVFQSQVPGGSMQVIRTQTVTTSSKSSKWMPVLEKGFENLELPINSLDLSSQKSKGSVGRSGSIGGRRPPSRPRSLISQSSSASIFGEDSSVARLCQRLHEQAKNEMFKSFSDFAHTGGQNYNGFAGDSDNENDNDKSSVVITEITNSSDSSQRNNLSRQKSCSNENLTVEKEDDSFRRSSKIRRSLQFPKQVHSPVDSSYESEWSPGKSLKERAAEIENLLRRGSSTATTISQDSDRSSESSEKVKTNKVRDSFVSAETLKEVRDRLKKANSGDDGESAAGEKEDANGTSRVKCFVYGMEAMMANNKKPYVNGTGSLESRSSSKNSCNGSRTSEWYRRRKSYGFEQVEESDKLNSNHRTESSTDSSICQSAETVCTPSWNRVIPSKNETYSGSPIATTARKEATNSSQYSTPNHNENSVYLDNNNTGNVFSIRIEESKNDSRRKIFRHYGNDSLESESVWNRKSPLPIQRKNDVRESLKSSLRSAKNPWISQLRGTKLVDRQWISDDSEQLSDENHEISEETKRDSPNDEILKLSDSDYQKKNKRVEFCKTEVHFAAESGKFNIVETDAKPPPNDIFRRRRRNSGPVAPKNPSGLPEIKFGDSVYEIRLLTTSDKSESISDKIEAELKELSSIIVEPLPQSKDRENEDLKNSRTSPKLYDLEEEANDNLRPRSILKNCRTSFLFGKNEDNGELSDARRQVPSPVPVSTPVWRSTVILRNKRFDDVRKRNSEDGKLYSSDGESELQIRFRNLRKADAERKKWWENASFNAKTEESQELKRRSLPDDILLRNAEKDYANQKITISSDEMPSLSVAERIKQVEEFKSNNYSSKINFRSGEMTVVQNGTRSSDKLIGEKQPLTSSFTSQKRNSLSESSNWNESRVTREKSHVSCDNITTSNPPVMRFSTEKDEKPDNQKYQTTRILINFQNESHSSSERLKTNNINNKTRSCQTYGSWSPGMRDKYFGDLKSTSLVKQTLHDEFQKEDIPKPSKPVHEIINQFDSLSLPKRNTKERRRKTMPINYKAPKEYTHSDLEEELKNFTENLDKDFKDIYEEEILSIRGSKNKNSEPVKEATTTSAPANAQKIEKLVQPVILTQPKNLVKSLSDEGPKISQQQSKCNYDSDDSDLLADEEVRSYMSTGQGGTDSEPEENNSWNSRKVFEDSIKRFKKLAMNGRKENKNDILMKSASYTDTYLSQKSALQNQPEKSKIASIALRYEDDPFFAKVNYKASVPVTKSSSANEMTTDRWEKSSTSSLTSGSKPRERASYLNGLSLSEKYSKYLQRSSNSSLDSTSQYNTEANNTRRRSIERVTKLLEKPHKESFIKETETSKYKHLSKSLLNSNDKIVKKNNLNEAKSNKYSSDKSSMDSFTNLEGKYKSLSYLEKMNHTNVANSAEKKRAGLSVGKVKSKEVKETDSVILEELTRAADQILVAVNGYTDEDSHLASSEEEEKSRRIIKKDKIGNLGTISEGKRVVKTETRRSGTVNSVRRTTTAVNNHSSASSLESLSKESIRGHRDAKPVCPRLKNAESAKHMSTRATRLLQRASSREALMAQPSSSEDIPTYLELAKKRSVRRQKSSCSTKSENENKAVCSRLKSKTKISETNVSSRTRDRKPTTLKDSTDITKSSRSSHAADSERTNPTSRRTVIEKTDAEATKRKRITHSHTKDEAVKTPSYRKKTTRVTSKKSETSKTAQPRRAET